MFFQEYPGVLIDLFSTVTLKSCVNATYSACMLADTHSQRPIKLMSAFIAIGAKIVGNFYSDVNYV